MRKKSPDWMPEEVVERMLTTPFGHDFVYFREYKGKRPKQDWNRKPIVGPPDRPFAELQYVERLEKDGWLAGWCYRPGKFISTWEPEKRPVIFPAEAQTLLDQIARRAGAKAGCWDVFGWKDGQPLFVELKRRKSSDRLREAQKRWKEAAVKLRVSPAAFKEIEWLGGCLDGYSLKAISVTQDHVDGWVRYRKGKFEFGGPDPREAKGWLEYYRRRTGLDGADLLWVLFRGNSSGLTCWGFEQSRDRKR